MPSKVAASARSRSRVLMPFQGSRGRGASGRFGPKEWSAVGRLGSPSATLMRTDPLVHYRHPKSIGPFGKQAITFVQRVRVPSKSRCPGHAGGSWATRSHPKTRGVGRGEAPPLDK